MKRLVAGWVTVTLWVTSVRAEPATAVGVPMSGPYPTLGAFFAELQQEDEAYENWGFEVTARTDHAAVVTIGDGSRKSSFVAVKGEHGWLVDRALGDGASEHADPTWVLHDNLRSTYLIVDLTERGSWVVLRAIDAGFFRHRGRDLYYCTGIEVLCRLDVAACAPPVPVAGRARCSTRARTWRPSRWSDWRTLDWYHPITLADDGTFTVPSAKRPRVPRWMSPEVADTLVAPPGRYPIAP